MPRNNLKELEKKILEEFRNKIYGKEDALFDRVGNNVSRQVENYLLDFARQVAKETIKNCMGKDKKFHDDDEVGVINFQVGYNQRGKDIKDNFERWVK